MQQDSVRPLPQSSSQGAIKDNLQKYSPFYKQAMHFNGEGVETLFYVAHDGFSSEKAVEKLEAFSLFKDKKIVFVEYGGAERVHVSDAVRVGNAEGVHEQPKGNSAHFTVKVKDKDSYASKELEISADGKCGIVSSMVALNEILRGEAQLSSEVLSRGDEDVSDPPQNGDTVESDSKNPFDDLLKKIYKPKVVKDEYGNEKYEDVVTLHHCVKDDLKSESPEFQRIFGNLPDQLKERVKKLLKETQESDWLEPQHVYEILTTNSDVTEKIKAGKLQNISAGNIFSFHASIPATLVAGESLPPFLEASSAPNADNKTLTRAGRPNEGMELEPDKTLKHEFRIIVLNILHEWIEGKYCEFSKINEDKFLESLIKEKLGDNFVEKIKTELGGEITFKSLLAIDEDLSPQVASSPTLASIPEESNTNQTEQLKKEREAFYSAPCGDGKKVFEKILDIAEKFCQDSSFTRDEHSKNKEILLEELKEVLENFTNLSIDDDGQIKLASINSLIHELEKKHLCFFEDEIEYQLALRNAGGGRSAQQGLSPARVEPDNTLFLASISPKARQAKPNYSYLDQANVGYDSKISQETFERAFTPGYSSNTQAFKMYTFSPALIQKRLSERRAVGVQTNVIAADHPTAAGFFTPARAEPDRGPILPAGNSPTPAPTDAPPAPARAEPAQADPAQTNLSVKKRVTWKDQPEPSNPAQPAEGEPKVDWEKSQLRTSELPRKGDKYLSRRKTTENSSQDDFLGELEKFRVWIYEGGKAFLDNSLDCLTKSILSCSETFNIQSFSSDKKRGVSAHNNDISASTHGDEDLKIFESLLCLGGNDSDRNDKDEKKPNSNPLVSILSELESCIRRNDKSP